MHLLLLTLALCTICIATVLKTLSRRSRPKSGALRRLPGPRGLPIIGSVHELPEKCSWLKFAQWGEEYGPIYQVNLAGTNHVWISTDQVARDLLSKKGNIYSDRPHIPALIDDNRTSAQYLPLLSKNDAWTRQRKFARHIMDQSEKASFYHYPELEAIRLLKELMENPKEYNHALESFIARVTCRLAWGHSDPSDELKQRARELLIGVSPTGALGNKLGFIMSLPDWLVPAKAWERRRAKTERKFFEIMQDQVMGDIHGSQASPSWMRTFLEARSSWNLKSDLEGAYAVGMHGIAGALTIAAPMQSFILAMCFYPQYQARLHEEIDRVCGDRMPQFSDMPAMPVLRAFIREALRWRPPVPTGIPHELTQDDEYNGYLIPAGSVMHPLEWSISRDPSVFPDPEIYNPSRWLDPSYPTYSEPLTKYPTITGYSQFGYGRRVCQGQGVTEADLFVGIGSMAWLFHLSKDLSEFSKQGEVALETTKPRNSEPLGLHKKSSTEPLPTAANMHGGTSAVDVSEKHLDPLAENAESVPKGDSRGSSSPTQESIKPAVTLSLDPANDPTLQYSTLLIAKPKPFSMKMKIRSETRAEYVKTEYSRRHSNGEFKEDRVFWEENGELGWGKV